VGIDAIVQRAAVEGAYGDYMRSSVIVEGAHVVPGFLNLTQYEDRVLSIPVIITVDDEDRHRAHFVARSTGAAMRSLERYERGFPNIRKVQKYIKSQALSHGVTVIDNYDLDQALSKLMDHVVEKAIESLRNRSKRRHPVRRS